MKIKDAIGQPLKKGDKVAFAPRCNGYMPHVRLGEVTFLDAEEDDVGVATIHYVTARGNHQYRGSTERLTSTIIKVAA